MNNMKSQSKTLYTIAVDLEWTRRGFNLAKNNYTRKEMFEFLNDMKKTTPKSRL